MVRIDVAFIPAELEAKSPKGSLAVLIDVVRATTTIVTALAHGCSFVLPVLHVEDAFQLKHDRDDSSSILLGGERGGKRVRGFDLGNSPGEYTRAVVRNKGLIFSTTNGTRTLLALNGASEILVGSFVNISAVCEYITQKFPRRSPATLPPCDPATVILIACSGVMNTFSLEDTVCAGMLVTHLTRRFPEASKTPSATSAEILYHHYASALLQMLRISDGGKRLIPIDLGDDLQDCADVDRYDLVPKYVDGKIIV